MERSGCKYLCDSPSVKGSGLSRGGMGNGGHWKRVCDDGVMSLCGRDDMKVVDYALNCTKADLNQRIDQWL
jgi:hypothetical protein